MLVLLATQVAVFAALNPDPLAVNYPGGAVSLTAPQLVGAAYLLGMASGWTVVGLARRSLWKAADTR